LANAQKKAKARKMRNGDRAVVAKEPDPEPEPEPTYPWAERFLEALRNSANVRAACMASGVSRQTVYRVKKADEAFRVDWEDAHNDALDLLEAAVFQKAMRGQSDVLSIFLLKSHRPEVYREQVALMGADGGPVKVSLSGMVHLAEAARKKRLLAAGETLLEEVVDGEYQEVE
jgi:hypothetical protein